MKKILFLSVISMFVFACGKQNETTSIDDLIESKNIKAIQERRALLQTDLSKIDDALSKLDTIAVKTLVTVITVKDTVFKHYIDLQGNVETKENILIQPEISGNLMSLYVKAGQHVNKGQILAKIDDSGMSQQLSGLETQYELAKTTYEKQKNLWNQKIGSEIQYLQAKTQMVSLQKSVAQLKTQLEKTNIKAPFTGIIDDVFVERGQIVAPNPQGLMRIVNLNNMFVTTSVPETNIGKLKVGDPVEVAITSLGKKITGKIRQVGSYINPSNRTFGIEISVPNTEKLLRPNQVAKLKIADYTNPKTTVVPAGVVQKDAQGNQFVFVVEKNNKNISVAKKTIVKTGQTSDNRTEILEGLSELETVVSEGADSVSDGMSIEY